MALTLPDLPYDYGALEPTIDARTMEIHHDKHHQAYVDNANKALEGTEWADKPVEEVLQNLGSLPEDKQAPVRNKREEAAGGAYRARGRGGRDAGARPADQAGGAGARDLGQDRRSPRPERLREDRGFDPRRGDPVRDGARPRGMGRIPDCGVARSLLASSLAR